MNNKYTVGDLFAGAGGLSKAFQQAGTKVVWANDIDKNACQLYKENFNDVCLVEGDIKNIEDEEIPKIDILVGGFPCQSFSVMGYNNKFNDKRENLFLEILRILKVKKPKAFLLENIKGLMSHDNGRTFKLIIESLHNEGYFIKSKVLNSIEYGNIPHNRERMYIVGFRSEEEYNLFEFPEKIKLTTSFENFINFNDKKDEHYYYKYQWKYYVEFNGELKRKNKIYQLTFRANENHSRVKECSICPNLTSEVKSRNAIVVSDVYDIRKMTPCEYFNFLGYFEIKIPNKIQDSHLYKYAGNCSSVTVVERIAENIINALNNNVAVNDNKIKEVSVENIEEFIKKEKSRNEINKEISINNEKEFTLRMVIPALKNKNFFDVRYNHGIDEYGKDVTYKYRDNFEAVKYGAVQVKYGDISGGAKGEIDIILSQIADAFEMPYIDVIEGRENYISQLLIVCSGKYTQNAKAKILKKFKKGYDVRFFDGQDIDNLLGR